MQGSRKPETTPTCWRAIVSECPPSANVFLRTHFRKRKEQKEVWYALLYSAFFYEGVSRATGRRKVTLWIQSKKARDYPNLFLGADKLILDNLVRLGWLKDDSQEWLELAVNSSVGEPQTIIEIQEAPVEGGSLSAPSTGGRGGR